MSRGALVRLLLVLGLLGGCAALALTQEPKLGLDLRGGTQITLQASDSPSGVKADAEATDRAIEILRGRVDALGISEPTLTRAGENRIIVELPDVQDPRQAVETIGRTAQLTVHPVVKGGIARPRQSRPWRATRSCPATRATIIEVGPSALEGDDITGAQAVQRQNATDWTVAVDFSGAGSSAFGTLTAAAACAEGDAKRIAILLDGEVISSPGRQRHALWRRITGATDITGQFSLAEAKDLAVLIEGGALPLPVEVIEQRVVGPTLGKAAIEASWQAALIGLLLTGLFIAAVYRLRRRARDGRTDVVRPARLRHPRRPRLDLDPPRPGRVRAGDRARDRRQRAGLRASP